MQAAGEPSMRAMQHRRGLMHLLGAWCRAAPVLCACVRAHILVRTQCACLSVCTVHNSCLLLRCRAGWHAACACATLCCYCCLSCRSRCFCCCCPVQQIAAHDTVRTSFRLSCRASCQLVTNCVGQCKGVLRLHDGVCCRVRHLWTWPRALWHCTMANSTQHDELHTYIPAMD